MNEVVNKVMKYKKKIQDSKSLSKKGHFFNRYGWNSLKIYR